MAVKYVSLAELSPIQLQTLNLFYIPIFLDVFDKFPFSLKCADCCQTFCIVDFRVLVISGCRICGTSGPCQHIYWLTPKLIMNSPQIHVPVLSASYSFSTNSFLSHGFPCSSIFIRLFMAIFIKYRICWPWNP